MKFSPKINFGILVGPSLELLAILLIRLAIRLNNQFHKKATITTIIGNRIIV